MGVGGRGLGEQMLGVFVTVVGWRRMWVAPSLVPSRSALGSGDENEGGEHFRLVTLDVTTVVHPQGVACGKAIVPAFSV